MTAPRRNRYKGFCAKCGHRLGIEEGYYMGNTSSVYYTRDGDKRERFRDVLYCDFCLATYYHEQQRATVQALSAPAPAFGGAS